MIRRLLSLSLLLLIPAQSFASDVSFLNSIDKAADPCTDFFQYACGNWLAKNEIPSDQTRWGRFNELIENNRLVLRDILEKASAPDPKRTPVEQKIGDFYQSCMDEKAIDDKGISPLKTELDRIAAISGKAGFAREVGLLQLSGADVVFGFDSTPDAKDSTREIAEADQGGLGLPDRDYYLKQDPKSAEMRDAYLAHVGNMLQLLGDSKQQAAAEAKTILAIETDLAKASMSRTDRRDPEKVYHKMGRKEFYALAPSFNWDDYFGAVEPPAFSSMNVAVPGFFKDLDKILGKYGMADWKVYLRWHLIDDNADFLPSAFVAEHFDFFGHKLGGQKQIQARWKRCVSYTDRALGEALGQAYVARMFGPEAKQRMLRMVDALEKALGTDIKSLPWMTEPTKKLALEKLAMVTNKIGYPDVWRDYSKLDIVRGDALGNEQRAVAFEARRQLDKIGKPVDKSEWDMTPPTVNAYYHPSENNINFPAGILQPPFFDNSMNDAVNFGAIGVVIGHELTHGFDDEGRKMDAQGNLNDWWTPQDEKEFEKRSSCLADEYSSFVTTADVHLNGRLTLGENTADNGGVRVALMALNNDPAVDPSSTADGYTPIQQFFLGFANVWCSKQTGESARMRAMVDPHSPGKYRVDGVVSNMPEFQQAFHCSADSPMVRKDACRIW